MLHVLAAGALLLSPMQARADFSSMLASESVNATIEAVSGLSTVLAEQNDEVERSGRRHEVSILLLPGASCLPILFFVFILEQTFVCIFLLGWKAQRLLPRPFATCRCTLT